MPFITAIALLLAPVPYARATAAALTTPLSSSEQNSDILHTGHDITQAAPANVGLRDNTDVLGLVLWVNNTRDEVDPTPHDQCCDVVSGDDRCTASPAGNECTLRAAVQTANSNLGSDIIIIRESPGSPYKLTIQGTLEQEAATGDLDILESVTIRGEGEGAASTTIIDADFIDRIFHIAATTAISDLTLRNGDTPFDDPRGGAIRFDGGLGQELTLERVVIAHNRSRFGGGIYNLGLTEDDESTGSFQLEDIPKLTIRDSTITDNHANQGGAIDNNRGILDVINTTISGNVAALSGAIANAGGHLRNVTMIGSANIGPAADITGRCDRGGNPLLRIFPNCVSESDPHGLLLHVANSIIPGMCDGRIVSEGYNLLNLEPQCRFPTRTSDEIAPDLGIAPLQDNGGPTYLTHGLQSGSPAIDRGPTPGDDCSGHDQRGVDRPQPQGGVCDIGAYEARSCEGEIEGSPCPDGGECRSGRCVANVCTGSEPGDCDDHDVDTEDGCDPGFGCRHRRVSRDFPDTCGDGFLSAAEQCDEGSANGTPDSCCALNCKFRPSSYVCRPTSGPCDVAETCSGNTGACSPDRLRPLGYMCRAAANPLCDEREVCDGVSTACPMDRFQQAGTECRLLGCAHSVCVDGTCQCRDELCGNGVVDPFEECDLGRRNSDSENTDACCSTGCRLHPLTWVCHTYAANPCIEPTTCRTGQGECPFPLFKAVGEPCVRDACIFNSSCQDGACGSGRRVCAVDVRAFGSAGVPKIQVRCSAVGSKQPAAHCASKGFLADLRSVLSPFGQEIFAPSHASDVPIYTGGPPVLQASSKPTCKLAADGVKSLCDPDIEKEVFICAAQQKLTGGRYMLCKPTPCGKALIKLATRCPQAMRTGVLNSKVVTKITGLKVKGFEGVTIEPRSDTKNCSLGACE